ncbi:unnamed protein product [Trichobilharzia szidati]|nr:unnamed protein product [Trichobilharzia szidati]
MNKKATDQTNVAQYFNHQNKNQKFDLPALLASGKYFIDELGFLVAPNGTRYRIPSGPPEGRKPLRLDKPQQLSKVNLNYSTLPFNKSHQTAHIELQDTNKLNGLSNAFMNNRENVSLYVPFLSTDSEFIKAASSTRTTLSNGSSLLNSINPNGFRSDILHSLDWNVILLTLIISSISLVLNTILIVFLSWRLSRHNRWRRREKYSDIVSYNSEEGSSQNVCKCEQSSCKYKGDKYSHLSLNHTTDFKCKLNSTEAGDYPCTHKHLNMDSSEPVKPKPRRLSHFWYNSTNPALEFQPQIYHNNGRYMKHVNLQNNDKVMINNQHLHVPNNFAKTSWAFQHHHHHNHQHPHEPVFCKAHEHLDVSSVNDGSWQMVASDGVITDDTSEENRDGSLDSKSNSDILFSPTIKLKKQRSKLLRKNSKKNRKNKNKKRKKLKRRYLDETLSESSMNNLHSIHPHDTYANKQNKISMVNKTPSINDQFTCSNPPHTTHIPSDYKLRILRDSLINYNRNVYVCHTLGIHLGILGALLSLLQLTAICIALVSRSTMLNKTTQELYHISSTSEFICLITSSLASDAILCARLYLLVAFTISSLTVLYIKTIFKFLLKITRLKDIQSHKFYLFKHIIPDCSRKITSFPDSGHHQRRPPSHRHHQGFAYIALMHSLPWALAAGTALLIAFSFYPSNHNSDVFEPMANTTQILMYSVKSSVNILFDGLDSLFTCSVRSARESTLNTMYPHISQSKVVKIPYIWIPSFLLIILPLILQTLIILSFIMLVFICRHKNSIGRHQFKASSKIMLIILTILLIEIISLCTPILYNMLISVYPEERLKLILVSRVIMLHLLADPLLMICLVEKYMKEDNIHEYAASKDEPLTCESLVNVRSYSNSNDQLPRRDPLDFTDDREMKVIENKDTLLQSKSLASPIRLFSCFPVNPYSFSHNRTTNTIENIQPLVMPCLPASGFIVPAMNSVSNSTPFSDAKLHTEMNSSGFLLPVSGNNNNIDASSNMIANTLHNLYSGGPEISIGHHSSSPLRDTQLIGNFTSLSDTSLTPEIDYSQAHTPTTYRNMKDAYPQLCQHHQRLLEQQYEQPSASSTVKRNRNFGSVPRFKQTTVTDFNALLIGKPTPDPSHRHSPSPTQIENTKPETVNEIFSLQQLRQTTGQSTATAAVMAAAAAAVAAQAGTLSRAVNPTISSLVVTTTSTSTTATTTAATDSLSLTNGTPPSPLFVNAQKQAEQTLFTEKACSDVNTVTH